MAVRFSRNAVYTGALAALCCTLPALGAQPAAGTTATAQSVGLQAPVDPLDASDQHPANEPTPMTPTRPQSKAAGLTLGSFRFFPGLSVSSLYDDNIFATRNDPQHGVVPQSDFVTVISPTIALKSNWARNQLNVDAGADIGRYTDHTQENYRDAWLGARGRYDFSARTNIFAGARVSRSHEARGSLDAVQGTEPTVYSKLQAHAGFAHRAGRLSLRLGGTFEKLNFDNVPSTSGGIINNRQRDRKLYTLGTRITYRLTPRFSPFVQAALDRRRYDTTPTASAGFDRNSSGSRLDLGVLLRLANGLRGEAYAGHLSQHYNDPRLGDVSRPDFGARLNWQGSARTKATAYLDRSLEETVLSGASAYLNTVLGVKVEHRLRPRLRFNIRAALGRSTYQGIDRNENLLIAGAGVKYDLTRYLYLGADYRFMHLESNLPSDVFGTAYYRNQIMLTLGSQVLAARPPANWSARSTGSPPVTPAGFYVGGQVGYGFLNTVTSGPRGEGEGEGEDEGGSEGSAENIDVGDLGNRGPDAGLFAGYGWLVHRWYLGLEMETDRSRASFYHANSKPNSRTFSLERTSSYGLSARLGYALPNDTLLYGRLGIVRTRFYTSYMENDLAANASNTSDTQRGTRYGVGVEIPTASPLFVRMDYAYTRYNSYPVYYGGANPETFNNSEGSFRLGLGWHFGTKPTAAPAQPATRVAGLYLGAAIGQGAVASHVTGLQRTQGQGPYQFNADFGNDGVSSTGFLGYGWTFRRLYAGVELVGEGSRTTWNHVRETPGNGGRDFSVEKQGGYGAALRLGYVMGNGTLLYGRIGRIHTQFSTRYDKGANTNTYIYEDNHETGTRLGVGADIPISRHLFLRTDYSFTRYPSYGFTTTQGGGTNTDQLNYKNTESLFRIGLGLHF